MFTNPDESVKSFELLPGMQVADLGAGSGSFVLVSAKMVGENGKVYAVDIQKELLPKIKREAEKEGYFNVEVIWGDVEKVGGSKLADSSIDVVIASNILFQVEDRESFIAEIKRVLKPNKGKVFVIDWQDSFGGIGPETKSVVSLDECKKIFTRDGFDFYKKFPTGPHHYGLAFKKK